MSLWPILIVWLASSLVLLAGWRAQMRSRNAGIVDVLWSGCMAASALFYSLVATGAALPRILVAVLGGVWGCRLALHLYHRVSREPEDGRYRYLREHWHDDQRNFFAFFMAQALFTALFSWPFYIAASNRDPHWTIWTTCGVAIWIVSLGGEAIADRQLAAFRSNPANRGLTCRAGLWRYSRHPNYFFEFLHWFAYVFLSIGVGGIWTAVSLLGPLLMLVSLCWLTGIPYVEAQALRSRGDNYRDYQRTTSALIPWFPRKN
jgi:steroid 5-alpha reductase family enzyme